MATVTIPIQVLIREAGECPMCGFDSLRKITCLRLSDRGVTTLAETLTCGRCTSDLQESM